MQLHLQVFQSFHLEYKDMKISGRTFFFFRCEGIALYFLKLEVKFIIKMKVRVYECNFANNLNNEFVISEFRRRIK